LRCLQTGISNPTAFLLAVYNTLKTVTLQDIDSSSPDWHRKQVRK